MKQPVSIKPFRMQPTFVLELPVQADEAITQLHSAIRSPELRDHIRAAGRCIEFQVAPAEQRFWSPHLSVQIGESESGSQLFGRFSPRPEIWTMFMAIYGVVLIVMFGAVIYGYVQWYLGETTWSLAFVPVGLIVVGSLHVASLVGQSLSADQMEILRGRLNRAIELAFSVEDMQQKGGL